MTSATPVTTASQQPRASLPEAALRVLVVEDDRDLQSVMERVLHTLEPDLVLDWAASVGEAIPLLRRNAYAFVLADYMLDGTRTGFSLRAWCDRHRPSVAFAMMSAFPIAENVASGRHRACPFLRKPFSVLDLRTFLQRMLLDSSPPG